MDQFNKKQKIILAIIFILIGGFICYYVYAKEDNSTLINFEDNIEIQEKNTEQNQANQDDKILVHISGAVNQEGIVELKVDSRVADAIDKVRRSKRGCQYGRG